MSISFIDPIATLPIFKTPHSVYTAELDSLKSKILGRVWFQKPGQHMLFDTSRVSEHFTFSLVPS